jgi:hypothetical protein
MMPTIRPCESTDTGRLDGGFHEGHAMPNGKAGDHPLTDLLVYGHHPFPADMEAMILRLHELDPQSLRRISFRDFADWGAGKNLDAGRNCLRNLLTVTE